MIADTRARAVSFDFGETLATLDIGLLVARLAERGVSAEHAPLEAALTGAWGTYDRVIRTGASGHPWTHFMKSLLEKGAPTTTDPALREELATWLFVEQQTKNLWRRPIPGMIEVCRDLRASGVPVGVLSNSEGKLAELIDEMGWSPDLPIVGDSGRLGIEKPDPRIFAWMAGQLGVPEQAVVHVGDSRAADVDGALSVGMRAIHFLRRGAHRHDTDLRPRSATAATPEEMRAALRRFGVPMRS